MIVNLHNEIFTPEANVLDSLKMAPESPLHAQTLRNQSIQQKLKKKVFCTVSIIFFYSFYQTLLVYFNSRSKFV